MEKIITPSLVADFVALMIAFHVCSFFVCFLYQCKKFPFPIFNNLNKHNNTTTTKLLHIFQVGVSVLLLWFFFPVFSLLVVSFAKSLTDKILIFSLVGRLQVKWVNTLFFFYTLLFSSSFYVLLNGSCIFFYILKFGEWRKTIENILYKLEILLQHSLFFLGCMGSKYSIKMEIFNLKVKYKIYIYILYDAAYIVWHNISM